VRELEAENEATRGEVTALETKILSMLLATPNETPSAKLALGIQNAKEETAAVKELLREREEEAEQAAKAQDELHESAIISLQKSMTIVMEELDKSSARADALESDLAEAKDALELKQQELGEIREHAQRVEEQSTDLEKIPLLESRIEALTAMLSMKSVGEGGGLMSEPRAAATVAPTTKASAAAQAAAAKATEVASGFWGSMTSSLGSFVATTAAQGDESGDDDDVDGEDNKASDSKGEEPFEREFRSPTKDLSAFLEEEPDGDLKGREKGDEGGASLDLNSFLEEGDGSGEEGDDYGF
jgi:hypothetical protein